MPRDAPSRDETGAVRLRPEGVPARAASVTGIGHARRRPRASSVFIRVPGTPCWAAAVVTFGERLGSGTLRGFAPADYSLPAGRHWLVTETRRIPIRRAAGRQLAGCRSHEPESSLPQSAMDVLRRRYRTEHVSGCGGADRQGKSSRTGQCAAGFQKSAAGAELGFYAAQFRTGATSRFCPSAECFAVGGYTSGSWANVALAEEWNGPWLDAPADSLTLRPAARCTPECFVPRREPVPYSGSSFGCAAVPPAACVSGGTA
jgi:hypothetical protein